MKTDKQLQRDLEKIAKLLRTLMKDVGEDACLYLANSTLNLCRGLHHTGKGQEHQENVIAAVIIRGMDGGDW